VPELPDVELYLHALRPRLVGQPLRARLKSPFLLRSVEPPLDALQGRTITGLRRLGKRIVWELEGETFCVFHLMIAGRFHLKKAGAKLGSKTTLAGFDLPDATLLLTEASTRKRASLHLVAGEAALAAHDPGGLEVLEADLGSFVARLGERNHTLKRALTSPKLFSGIGNAYSDEILHRARLSPFKQTQKLPADEAERLFAACRAVLTEWTARLREQVGDGFPETVTAFRPEMAVHGKYKQPCPDCGKPVQRIRYADKECNYCAQCQTAGKLLADRALSRLLKQDWPKTLEELERL
jgi:formamidopyrimidine-DNA glycosylase